MEKQGKLFTTFGIFGVIPEKLMQDKRAGANELRAYAAIQSFQGVKDNAFPEQDELSERAGLTLRSLQKGISNLKKWGWIEAKKKGFGKGNIYRCMVPVEIPEHKDRRSENAQNFHKKEAPYPPNIGGNYAVEKDAPIPPNIGGSIPPNIGGSIPPNIGGSVPANFGGNNIKDHSKRSLEKITVLTADAVAHAKTEMHTDLRNAFDVLHPKIHGGAKYAHDGKEAKSIDRVITRALGLVDNDPVKARELIREKLALFCRNLAKPTTCFWADKPCTPSMLYALWSHLVEEREVKHRQKLFRGRDPFLESIPEGISLDALLGGNYQEVARES